MPAAFKGKPQATDSFQHFERQECVCVFKAPRSRSRSRSALVTPQ